MNQEQREDIELVVEELKTLGEQGHNIYTVAPRVMALLFPDKSKKERLELWEIAAKSL